MPLYIDPKTGYPFCGCTPRPPEHEVTACHDYMQYFLTERCDACGAKAIPRIPNTGILETNIKARIF